MNPDIAPKSYKKVIYVTRTTQAIRPTEKLNFIDSLRGIAILLVIFSHTAQRIEGKTKVVEVVSSFGSMGVQLFFILSAYTLCLSFENRKGERYPLLSFYTRRWFRIAPMYFLGIVIYASYTLISDVFNNKHIFSTVYTFKNVLANVFFLHGSYPPANNNVVPGGWSIGTEMAFYAIFPLLFVLAKKVSSNKVLTLALPLVGLVGCYFLVNRIQDLGYFTKGRFLYFSLLNQLPCFLIGIAYFFLCGKVVRVGRGGFLLIIAFFLAAGIALIAKTFGIGITLYPVLSCGAFLLLIEGFRRNRSLNISALIRIGQLSYSMYVIHFLFAWYFSSFIANQYLNKVFLPETSVLLCFIFSVSITAALALFTERTVESYGIKLGKKWIANFQNLGVRKSEN